MLGACLDQMEHHVSLRVNRDSDGSVTDDGTPLAPALPIDGTACRGARAMLGLSQEQLCAMADVGRKLLNDFENGVRTPRARNVQRIRSELEGAGATFLAFNGALAVAVDMSKRSERTPRARSLGCAGPG